MNDHQIGWGMDDNDDEKNRTGSSDISLYILYQGKGIKKIAERSGDHNWTGQELEIKVEIDADSRVDTIREREKGKCNKRK